VVPISCSSVGLESVPLHSGAGKKSQSSKLFIARRNGQRQVFREPFRLVVSHAGEPLDLAKATCTRTMWPNGHLMEIVNLNGDYGLNTEDLENFIQSFPVERRAR
jgi:hypothetical protein